MEVEKIEAEIPPTISSSSSSSSSSSLTSNSSDIEWVDFDELKRMPLVPPPRNHRKLLSRQLSMREMNCEAAWEKRRRYILRRTGFETEGLGSSKSLADEDLDELKGSIELGFGFNEEEGQELCDTLPALDFYFAVNRQVFDPKLKFSSPSPVSTPRGGSSSSIGEMSSTFGSPKSPHQSEPWKICSPGDNPQHVKMRLRHWAQAVGCSVRQFS